MAVPNNPTDIGEGESPVKPVFYDDSQKRWPRLRLGMALIGLTMSLLLGTLVLSILASPILPALNLPGASILPHGAHIAPPFPATSLEQQGSKVQGIRPLALGRALGCHISSSDG